MIVPDLLERLKNLAAEHSLTIVRIDNEKPWGGEFVFDENQLDTFARVFFPGFELPDADGRPKMSPKFLVVAPHQRLSWQYHHRMGEMWRVLEGPVGVIRSGDDTQGEVETLEPGQQIEMKVGERHRLVGLDRWGVVPEIWVHTDLTNPSDPDDIIRVEDDYKR